MLLGVVHAAGHLQLVQLQAANPTEQQLFDLMTEYKTDLGAGFVRSMFDLLAGFSLTFSILPLGFGLVNWVVARRGEAGLRRAVAGISAVVFGAETVVGFLYWFLLPILFLAAATLLLAGAALRKSEEDAP